MRWSLLTAAASTCLIAASCSSLYTGDNPEANKQSKPYTVLIGSSRLQFSIPGGISNRYISDRRPVDRVSQQQIDALSPGQSIKIYSAHWDLGGKSFYPAASVHIEVLLETFTWTYDFDLDTLDGFEEAFWDNYSKHDKKNYDEKSTGLTPYRPLGKGEYKIVNIGAEKWMKIQRPTSWKLVRPYDKARYVLFKANMSGVDPQSSKQSAYDRIISPMFDSVLIEPVVDL